MTYKVQELFSLVIKKFVVIWFRDTYTYTENILPCILCVFYYVYFIFYFIKKLEFQEGLLNNKIIMSCLTCWINSYAGKFEINKYRN